VIHVNSMAQSTASRARRRNSGRDHGRTSALMTLPLRGDISRWKDHETFTLTFPRWQVVTRSDGQRDWRAIYDALQIREAVTRLFGYGEYFTQCVIGALVHLLIVKSCREPLAEMISNSRVPINRLILIPT
jgi:hypothetical protein